MDAAFEVDEPGVHGNPLLRGVKDLDRECDERARNKKTGGERRNNPGLLTRPNTVKLADGWEKERREGCPALEHEGGPSWQFNPLS